MKAVRMSGKNLLQTRAQAINKIVVALAFVIIIGLFVLLIARWTPNIIGFLSPPLKPLAQYGIPLVYLLGAGLLMLGCWYTRQPYRFIEKALLLYDEYLRRQKEREEQERQRRSSPGRGDWNVVGQKEREEQERQRHLEEIRRQREDQHRRELEAERQRQREFAYKSEVSRIKNLEPLELERYTAQLFERMGFQCTLTPRTGDHGIDVRLMSPEGQKEIAQCKQWKSGKKIAEKDLREFYGTLIDEKASRGYYVAPHGFTTKAEEWTQGKPIVLADANWLGQKARKFFPEPKRRLIFQSNFSNAADGWYENNAPDHRVFRRNGYYHVKVLIPEWEQCQHPKTNPIVDFFTQVDAQFATNGSQTTECGFIFRPKQVEQNFSYYRFGITRSGYYALHIVDGKNHRKCLLDYRFSKFLDVEGGFNTLTIQMTKQSISLGVNGITLATVEDEEISPGYVGLFVSAGRDNRFAEARFRNFQLYSIESIL